MKSYWLGLVLAAGAGCTRHDSASAVDPLVAKGKAVYAANCTACHNSDPNQDGSVGPAIAGSSLTLLESRVLRGEYPPGYPPKRATKLMVPLVHLKDDLPAISAYLASVRK